MRMTLVALGFRGDVEPLVALGGALARAGHQVRVATSPEFEAMVRGDGLDFAPVGPHASNVVGNEPGRRMIGGEGGIGGQLLRLRRLIEPVIEQLVGDALSAADDADALLFTPLANVGYVAEQRGVPSLMVSLWPKSRTSAFPAVGFPRARFLGGPYNRFTHLLLEQASWRPFQRKANRTRIALGLPPIRWGTPMGLQHKQRRPVIYGFSESVVPRPADWGDWLQLTGYWFRDPPVGWRPPAELTRFLADGEPPVVVTFGSMATWHPARLGSIAVEALRLAGRRGILVGTLESDATGDHVLHLPDVPYHWLFPKTAAVVHHGGAGTTAAALRAGVPSVVVPFFADQPFWASRVRELAGGPDPLPRCQLSAPRLAAAINQACTDPQIRRETVRVSEGLRAEDGLGRAVAAIEQHLASPAPLPG
ncbi:MAG: glycosyltransferase [Streptosporangiales bacterium]|nr:glycosyltransferase [Streptosporangiales bacterium]